MQCPDPAINDAPRKQRNCVPPHRDHKKKFDSKNYSPKIFFTHIDFLIEMQNNEILFDF